MTQVVKNWELYSVTSSPWRRFFLSVFSWRIFLSCGWKVEGGGEKQSPSKWGGVLQNVINILSVGPGANVHVRQRSAASNASETTKKLNTWGCVWMGLLRIQKWSDVMLHCKHLKRWHYSWSFQNYEKNTFFLNYSLNVFPSRFSGDKS